RRGGPLSSRSPEAWNDSKIFAGFQRRFDGNHRIGAVAANNLHLAGDSAGNHLGALSKGPRLDEGEWQRRPRPFREPAASRAHAFAKAWSQAKASRSVLSISRAAGGKR